MPATRRLPIGTMLFLLFCTFTLLELYVIFWLARVTSWGFTILLAIVSAIVGSVMAKRAGLSVLARAKEELGRGQFPARPLADGMMILLGGALLITPGLITDVIGFTTLIPFFRRIYARVLIGWAKKHFRFVSPGSTGMFTTGGAPAGKSVFDAPPGSFHSEETAPQSAPKPSEPIDVEFKRVE